MSAPELGRTGDVAVSASNPGLPLKEARSPRQVAMSRVEEAFRTCLLPSLQLVPANPAVGMEIWEVMSLLPYEVGVISLIYDFLNLKVHFLIVVLLYESCSLGKVPFIR